MKIKHFPKQASNQLLEFFKLLNKIDVRIKKEKINMRKMHEQEKRDKVQDKSR